MFLGNTKTKDHEKMSKSERQRRKTTQHSRTAAVCKAAGFFLAFNDNIHLCIYLYKCGIKETLRGRVVQISTSEKCFQYSSCLA